MSDSFIFTYKTDEGSERVLYQSPSMKGVLNEDRLRIFSGHRWMQSSVTLTQDTPKVNMVIPGELL